MGKFLNIGSMKGERVGVVNRFRAETSPGSTIRIIARFFQFIMGLVVIGLYAQDLDRAHKAGVKYDSKWMFATITGTLASVYALVCMIPPYKPWFFFYFDGVFFILYTTAFGIFGKMYIKEDPEGNAGIQRMKNAVWILLVNMLLWCGTFAYSTFIFIKYYKGRTTHTGRAPAHPQMSHV